MCVSMYVSRLYTESKNHLKELAQFSPSSVWVPGTKFGSLSWHLASFPYEPPCQPLSYTSPVSHTLDVVA